MIHRCNHPNQKSSRETAQFQDGIEIITCHDCGEELESYEVRKGGRVRYIPKGMPHTSRADGKESLGWSKFSKG